SAAGDGEIPDDLDEDFGEEEVSAAGGGEISDDLGEDFGEEEVSAAGDGEISDDLDEDFGEEEVSAAGGGEISEDLDEDFGEEEVSAAGDGEISEDLEEEVSAEGNQDLSEEDQELAADLAETSTADDVGCDDDFCEESVIAGEEQVPMVETSMPEVGQDQSQGLDEAALEDKLNADIEATAQAQVVDDEIDTHQEQREKALRLIASKKEAESQRGFSGLQVDADGGVVMSFHSGIKVKLQSHVLNEIREFTIDNCLVSVCLDPQGEVSVEVDGLSICLPEAS
ncbi:MAG: hypothetical protein AB8C84_12700, partial [Oligoflexales bacterium]